MSGAAREGFDGQEHAFMTRGGDRHGRNATGVPSLPQWLGS